MAVNYTPDYESINGNLKTLKPFRFWCQKVLPLVYDDSLSYYELLNKVVQYLNDTMENVDGLNDNVNTLDENVRAVYQAYDQLQDYVNNYFDNLNVQSEINNKLDVMAIDGTLSAMVSATATPLIPDIVAEWLSENIQPTTPAVDGTLSISGAAADSKVTGDNFKAIRKNISDKDEKIIGSDELRNAILGNINNINNIELFYEASEYATVANFIDCGTIAKTVPADTLISTVSFSCGVTHYPILAIINSVTRELLYLEEKGSLYNSGDIATFIINTKFDVDTFVVISKPKYVFRTEANSVLFKPINYDTLRTSDIGDIINYNEELTNKICYACNVYIGVSKYAYQTETRKYNNWYNSLGGTNNNFNAYGVIEKAIPANINISKIEYTVGVSNIKPSIAIINSETRELLFKKTSSETKAIDETVSFNLDGISFNVPTYVLIYASKYLFVNASYSDYDKVNYDSVAPATINNADIGDIITFEDNPSNFYVTYTANVEIYYTFANEPIDPDVLDNLIIVAKEGGDYNTVSEAVANAVTGDTVFILPGVYENETIEAWGKKINIIGFDRDSVVIKNNNNDYYRPALEMAKGVLKHVTILQDEDIDSTITSGYPYCIHIDHNDLIGETFIIEDCYLDAKFNAALGIGLRNNGNLIVRDCILKTEHNLNSANVHIGAVFVHPGQTGMNQNMQISNCEMHSKYGSALHFENVYQQDAQATVAVMQSFLWSEELGKSSGIVSMQGTNQNVFVSNKTFGNNVEITPIIP